MILIFLQAANTTGNVCTKKFYQKITNSELTASTLINTAVFLLHTKKIMRKRVRNSVMFSTTMIQTDLTIVFNYGQTNDHEN